MRAAVFGGSWVVISGLCAIVITHIKGLITITPHITTHEPPSVGHAPRAMPRPRAWKVSDASGVFESSES